MRLRHQKRLPFKSSQRRNQAESHDRAFLRFSWRFPEQYPSGLGLGGQPPLVACVLIHALPISNLRARKQPFRDLPARKLLLSLRQTMHNTPCRQIQLKEVSVDRLIDFMRNRIRANLMSWLNPCAKICRSQNASREKTAPAIHQQHQTGIHLRPLLSSHRAAGRMRPKLLCSPPHLPHS